MDPRPPKNFVQSRVTRPNAGRAPKYTNFGPPKETRAIQMANVRHIMRPPKKLFSPPRVPQIQTRISPMRRKVPSPNRGIYISTPQKRVRINGKLVSGYSPKAVLIAKLKTKGIDVDPNMSVKQIGEFLRQYAKLGGPPGKTRTRAELVKHMEKAATLASKPKRFTGVKNFVEIEEPTHKRGREAWLVKMAKMWTPLNKRTKQQIINYGNRHKIGGLKMYKKKNVLIGEIERKLDRDVRSILRNVVLKANSPSALNKLSMKHILDRLIKEYGWHASKNVNRAKIQHIVEDEYKNYINA